MIGEAEGAARSRRPTTSPSTTRPAVTFTPDLDAYFARLGDDGPREPNLSNLDRLVAAHARGIPFENLDVLLGKGISLAAEDVERKLVHAGRGGYCFEQNSLMLTVLTALGYDVQPISARVRIGRPRSVTPARTHLFLRVELDGRTRLVDVGVGALSLTSSIELVLDTPQETPHETRRIVATGEWDGLERRSPDARLYHQVRLGDAWEDVCDFTLEEMHPIDRELGNWYTSAHPESHFGSRLVVARATETGRVSLLNWELKRRDASGDAETRTLESEEERLAVLRDEFGLDFPEGTRFPLFGEG